MNYKVKIRRGHHYVDMNPIRKHPVVEALEEVSLKTRELMILFKGGQN